MKEQSMPDFSLENAAKEEGYAIVCGVDEAGRGPLCGPVVAGAVILPPEAAQLGINDSKKLSEKKREALFEQITKIALAYGIGMASPEEIDAYNILNATMLAMNRAVAAMGVRPDLLLIDGNCARGIELPARTVVKGDAKSISIGAASILAKVTRDRIMLEYDALYPQYQLARHKGYPTATHIALVREHGVNEIYRRSFLKKIL